MIKVDFQQIYEIISGPYKVLSTERMNTEAKNQRNYFHQIYSEMKPFIFLLMGKVKPKNKGFD